MDKRRFLRYSCDIKTRVLTGDKVIYGKLSDISFKGSKLKFDVNDFVFYPGEFLEIEIIDERNLGIEITFNGIIRYRKDNSIGIQIVNFDSKTAHNEFDKLVKLFSVVNISNSIPCIESNHKCVPMCLIIDWCVYRKSYSKQYFCLKD